MTNREKIEELIKTNFPNIEVYWEQIGDLVKKDKDGVEVERHPAFGSHLVIAQNNSSKMEIVKWLDDECGIN